MHIILASKSPRRKELLERAGYVFDIVPSEMKEIITKKIPHEVVCELSHQKAQEVFNRQEKLSDEKCLVIGADTIVAIDKLILGKPNDEKAAFDMLYKLQGRTHEVFTGVTLVYGNCGKVLTHTFYEGTRVTFYPMTDEEIKAYIATGDPLDKAGAYGIQGPCGIYIKKIEGDYNNVVGLPIARLYQELKSFMSSCP